MIPGSDDEDEEEMNERPNTKVLVYVQILGIFLLILLIQVYLQDCARKTCKPGSTCQKSATGIKNIRCKCFVNYFSYFFFSCYLLV